MFDRIKKRYWGEELYSTPVASTKKASVYLWERNGILTLNIKSENFSYIQGPGRNDGTVTFAASEINSLLTAIQTAQSRIQSLLNEG